MSARSAGGRRRSFSRRLKISDCSSFQLKRARHRIERTVKMHPGLVKKSCRLFLRLDKPRKSSGFAPLTRNVGRRFRPKSRFFQRARCRISFCSAPFPIFSKAESLLSGFIYQPLRCARFIAPKSFLEKLWSLRSISASHSFTRWRWVCLSAGQSEETTGSPSVRTAPMISFSGA